MTLGATESIYSAIQAVVGPGDEVIIFDPSYDSYDPAVRLAGGRCIRLPLQPPGFRYDWDRVRAAINDRTRLVLFNTPHNPACTAAPMEDLNALADVIRGKDILVMSDEVYEHVVYDGRTHASVHDAAGARREELYRVLVRQDHACDRPAGRLLHRAGRADARAAQGAPVQHLQHLRILSNMPSRLIWRKSRKPGAGCRRFSRPSATGCATHWRSPVSNCRRRRELISSCWISVNSFRPTMSGFAERLLTEAGVATIPLSPFYAKAPALSVVRLCIAKRDATLDEAVLRINGFAARLGRAGA